MEAVCKFCKDKSHPSDYTDGPVEIFQPKTVLGRYYINHLASEIVMAIIIIEAMIVKTISLIVISASLFMAAILRLYLVPADIISGYFRVSTVGENEQEV